MTIEEIRQRAERKLSADDYRKMSVSEIAQIRMDVKRLLKELDAFRAQQEHPNEPLTLDELREMDGEPVYCVDVEVDGIEPPGWYIVDVISEEIRNADYVAWEFENYGKTWFAYRHKPEQED